MPQAWNCSRRFAAKGCSSSPRPPLLRSCSTTRKLEDNRGKPSIPPIDARRRMAVEILQPAREFLSHAQGGGLAPHRFGDAGVAGADFLRIRRDQGNSLANRAESRDQ